MVEQSTRSGDDDLRPGTKGADLRIEPHAAVDGRGADRALGAVGSDALLDLERKLAGRGQDEAANRKAGRATAAGLPGRQPTRFGPTGVEDLEDGEDESGRLAGARLGACEQVASGEYDRDGFGLDRRGLGVALRGDGTEELGRQPELFEWHGEKRS